MIFLMTGVPGASKTLNTIKFINEDQQFKDRTVYVHNIRDLKPSNEKGDTVLTGDWIPLDDEQALKWYELPSGSIVVFDECQDLFPVNTTRKGPPPDYLGMFAKHRHLGIDVFLVTQEPRNIDSFVRRLVNTHRHHERIFGSSRVKVAEWPRCVDQVHDWHERQQANLKQTSMDSKYFGVYHSADLHTQKTRLPYAKIALVLVPLLVIPLAIYSVIDVFTTTVNSDDVFETTPSTASIPFDQSFYGSPERPVNYLTSLKPRLDGMPWTAPIYDSVREPQQYPWPSCVHWVESDSCLCYTQQATKMDIPHDTCMNIVKNGIFDHAKEPDDESGRGRALQSERSPTATHTPSGPSVVYLHDNEPTTSPSSYERNTNAVRSNLHNRF